MKWLFSGLLAVLVSVQAEVYKVRILQGVEGGSYQAFTLNNQGLWAGHYQRAGGAHTAVRQLATHVSHFGTIGGADSRLNALSNDKWAAGYSLDATGKQRAILQWDDYLEDLSFFQPAGYGESEALGMSDIGHVSGWVKDSAGNKRAFHYFRGRFFVIGDWGMTSHIGYDIDSVGTVIGTGTMADGTRKGFLYRQHMAEPEFIPTLGGASSAAYAMGSFMNVVGEAETAAGSSHAYIYDFTTKVMQDIGVLPGDRSSKALAANSKAEAVGESVSASGVRRGFVYSKGALMDLNQLIASGQNLTIRSAIAINDSSAILAEAVYAGLPVNVILTVNPQSDASIDAKSVSVRTDGSFTFNASGPSGSRYVLQTSSDLQGWVDQGGTNTFGDLPSAQQDAFSTTKVGSYYRIRILP